MSERRFNPERAAVDALNRYGMGIIWALHMSAARLYREGDKPSAWLALDVADAAERIWLRRTSGSRG